MNDTDDTAVKKRFENVLSSKTFKRIADSLDLPSKRVLDLGCGYGEYLQRARKDSVGITSTVSEVTYGKRVGIDIRRGNVELLDQVIQPTEKFDLFWANNLFEHLLSPHSFLVNLKAFARNDTMLVLGVPMVPRIQSLMYVKKFRGALASPHINFFNKKTFLLTVERAGWRVNTIRPYIFKNHLIDTSVSELAPHLYVVAHNDPSYDYPPKKLGEWQNDPLYQDLIEIMSAQY